MRKILCQPILHKRTPILPCLLWVWALACHAFPATAQAPYLRFENLSTEDGLSQASVHAIFQDSSGFMWFGTQDGLNRWDGARFIHFRNLPDDPTSISDNRIKSIDEDRTGILWIGTDRGTVDAYDPATGEFRHVVKSLADGQRLDVGEILVTLWNSDHELWIGSMNGLFLLNILDDSLLSLPFWQHESASPTRVNDLVKDLDGQVHFSHHDGLGRVQWISGRPVAVVTQHFERDQVTALAMDADGKLWTAAGHRVGRLDENIDKIDWLSLESEAPSSLRINQIFFDRGRRMWIVTSNGLFLYLPDSKVFHAYREHSADSNSLSDNELYTVIEDQGGMLWIGSLKGGADRWHPASLALGRYPADQTDGAPSIYAFATTPDHDLWIGTFEGLLRRRPGTDELLPFPEPRALPGFPQNIRALSLLGDRKGQLWIGTQRQGLIRLAPGGESFTVFPQSPKGPGSLPVKSIMSLFESSDGTVFVGTSGGGLAQFIPESESFKVFKPGPGRTGLGSERIPRIAEAGPGSLWLAVYNTGLDHLDLESGKVTHFRSSADDPTSLPAESVSCLHVDDSGRLWVGTLSAGFARLESLRLDSGKAEFRSWSEAHGLPNNTIYGILSDHEGHVWLSTNRGLLRFDPKAETFRHFEPRHGLQDWEFNYGAYFQDRDGALFFGGINGFNQIYTQNLQLKTSPPPIAISHLEISNRAVPVPKELSEQSPIQLSYEDSSLSFGLAALDFWAPEENRFSYKLEGFDKDWLELEENRPVVYTNLDPGSYTFRAKASNSEGVWTEAGLEVPIFVEYAPWETWWAWCLYAAFGAGLIYTGVRWRISALERRSEELKQLVDLRTSELKDTVLQLKASEGSALEAKRRALKSLEEALEERRKAQEADQAKSIFLSNMSHELRTPLNAVLGFAQLMERDPQLTAGHRESLKVILRSGEHLLRLINDVLSLAKIEAGRLTLAQEPFLLHRLCRDVGEMVGPKAEEKLLELQIDIADSVPQAVEGDSGRLIQVLLNLIGNAVKFTSHGTVTLKVSMKSHLIDFAVIDTGVGIPESELEQLFEPFQQTAVGRAEKEGTGLGLAISERLVELMGGTLRVDSRPGEGSTFAFALPLPTADPELAKKETRRVVALGLEEKPPKILITDDNAENRAVLSRLFEEIGFPVRTAKNGLAAVEKWRDWRPSLIWMDMRMPVMDGYEATRQIRSEEAQLVTGRTTILALTASAFEDDQREILEAGCDDVITKPYQEHTLFEKMAEHLNLSFVYGEPERENFLSRSEEASASKRQQQDLDIRILIAEDNPSNQMVARRMLERLGYQADVVPNGSLVQEAFAKHTYPLVLMDIRMPKMDGTEATRRLRSSLTAEDQPAVIALTGLASEDERKMCIAAGMDDLLAKPFRIEDLQDMIRQWLPTTAEGRRRAQLRRQLPSSDPSTPPTETTREVQGALNLRKLDLIRQLDDRGDTESLAAQVISLFLDTVPGQLKELQRAVHETDLYSWRRVAHSLKNSSSTLGADTVSETCSTLEQLARTTQDPESAKQTAIPILERLQREVEQALTALSAEKGGSSR